MEAPSVSFVPHNSMPCVAHHDEVGNEGDEHLPPPGAVDWSSPDQVAMHVSKTTLTGMQRLWRSHAAAMDVQGRAFAQTVFSLHSQALKEVANMKTFEPRQVTAVLNSFTAGVREEVLKIFQVMRQADDGFAQGLHQTSRKAFTRNLREALEAKDMTCADKIQRLKVQHEQALAQQRSAAVVALQQDALTQRQEIMRLLKDENRKKLAEAIQAITAQLTKQYNQQLAAAQATLEANADNASYSSSLTRPMTAKSTALTSALSTGGEDFKHISLAPSMAGALSMPGMPGGPPPLNLFGGETAADAAAANNMMLDMLKALAQQDDDNVGNILARKEMEASVKAANQAAEELRTKVDDLTVLLQQERADIEAWKEKWTQESSKTDAIKRECLQVIVKCEKRVKTLQEEHHLEVTKRDIIVQRSKDTIIRLEARLAELTGQSADPRLVPFESPGRPHQPSLAANPVTAPAIHTLPGPSAALNTTPAPMPLPALALPTLGRSQESYEDRYADHGQAQVGIEPSLAALGHHTQDAPSILSPLLHRVAIPPAPGGTSSVSASPVPVNIRHGSFSVPEGQTGMSDEGKKG